MEKANLKKCQVVMLPTNQKAEIGLLALYKDVYKNKEYFLDIIHRIEMQDYLKVWTRNGLLSEGEESRGECTYQHLYILSDDEIKKGDWVYDIFSNEIKRIAILNSTGRTYKKIIATTDTSLIRTTEEVGGFMTPLCFPQLSKSFIQKYIEEYNKSNIITDVMVEYDFIEGVGKEFGYESEDITILKISPKDNTITIRPIKDSYTREEIIKFGEKCIKAAREFYSKDGIIDIDQCCDLPKDLSPVMFNENEWIKENL